MPLPWQFTGLKMMNGPASQYVLKVFVLVL
jgi:hypothetical protein